MKIAGIVSSPRRDGNIYLERSELKEFDNKVVCLIAIASVGGMHTVSTITSNLIHHSRSVMAGWAILTRFYRRRGQVIKDENNRKSIEKLVEQMYSALQEKGNRKKHNETE